MAEYYGVQRASDYLAHYGVRGMKWGVRKALERGDRAALSRQYKKATLKLAKLSLNANRDYQRKRFTNAKRNMLAGALGSAGMSAVGTAAINNRIGRETGIAAGIGALGGALANSRGIMSGRHISDRGHARAIAKRNEWRKEMEDTFSKTGVSPNAKTMRKFHSQITALSDQSDPRAYAIKQNQKADADSTRLAKAYVKAHPSIISQQAARGSTPLTPKQRAAISKWAINFENHYQAGLKRGMSHVEAENYANRKLSGSSRKRKRT